MKKIISILLMLCMVLTLCVCFTACDTETVTPYTQLRDHLNGELTPGQSMVLENTSANIVVYVWSETTEGEGDPIAVKAETPMGTGYTGHVTFQIYNDSTEYTVDYVVFETESKKVYHSATVQLSATDYTGNDVLVFSSVNNIPADQEFDRRQNVTAIFNTTLTTLDSYLNTVNLSVTDFGFENLSDKYLAANTTVEADEDLGGIFSAKRWIYSGEMLVLGMGMIFLVLAILWGILAIFAKTMGGAEKPVKAEKPAPKADSKPVPAPAPVKAVPTAPIAPATSDDAIVTAITAAIAMTIASDESLSQEFAGGFRVVSFRKKSGKSAWNR